MTLLQNIEEFGQDEIDDIEDRISTTATTAETVDQLALEVETLQGLERMALGVLQLRPGHEVVAAEPHPRR